MSIKPGYLKGFAVIRIDDGPVDVSSRVREWTADGVSFPTAGPWNVKVKEVVMSAEEARLEVVRLNELNAGKGCMYYWQPTHIFLDGGSHAATPTTDEDQDLA